MTGKELSKKWKDTLNSTKVLVGQVFRVQIADGYGWYVIKGINVLSAPKEETVDIEHIECKNDAASSDFFESYIDSYFGYKNRIRLSWLLETLKSERRLHKLFTKNERKSV